MMLEDRVREAFVEAAGTLDDMPPLRLPQRAAKRRRLPTFAIPALAAATVAVLVVAIMAVSGTLPGTRHDRPGLASPGASGPATLPPRPAKPPRFIVAAPNPGSPVVLDADSGRKLATIPLPSEFGLVTALPDNRTFILTSDVSRTVRFYRVRLDEHGRPGRPTALPGTADSVGAGAMAVSPDGSRLAYASRTGIRTVHVVDLNTGRTRTWTGRTDGNISSLSWSPDGRTVAAVFVVEGGNIIELLDTTSPGTGLDAGRQIVVPEDGTIAHSAVYAADGASLIGVDEVKGYVVRIPIADRPPRTTVITRLKDSSVLSLAGSGRHLLLAHGSSLVRIDLVTGKSTSFAFPGLKPTNSGYSAAW